MSIARGGPVRTDAERRRTILLLRGLVVVAVGGLLADAGLREAGSLPLILVAGFALSNAALAWVPLHVVESRRFELVLGALDLLLVGVGIQLAGAGSGALPVSCLLMTLVAALAEHRSNMAAGAAAVGALHAWLALGPGAAAPAAGQLALQILFLCAVGLHYATLTEGVHHRRRRARVEELQEHELRTLVEILDSVSSTLDEVTVAQTVVTKLDELVPSLRCSLLHVDDRSRCFVLASHDSPGLARLPIDLAKYPEVREALQTRAPVIIGDSYTHPLTHPVREQLAALGYRSIAVLPLCFGEEVFGVLALRAARCADGGFSRAEIGMCRAVARASANAMKNAVLHRRAIEESERRRASGEKLSRILNHSPDLILTTDAEGRIAEANRAAERVLGCSREQLLGRQAVALLVDGATDLPARVRAAGVIPNLPARVRREDGGEIEVELHLTVLDDGAARAGALWIGRDITELKTAQLQLLQAEKLSTVGKVISGVAHELNNPLSAVLGYSQLMLSRGAPAGHRRELERIHEAALRCQKIVKNLLSFSRREKPERKRLGINGILEKTLDLKKYQLHVGGVDVVREFAPDLPLTLVDFHQMQQVFLNLIQNAQQAIHAARRDGRLVVRTAADGATIRVEIADNGTGMDPQTLEHVFDPFFTTKQQGEGTGLGLSVSYGIVREHGGRIWARSREGAGTSFFVELPVVAAPAVEASDPPRPALAAARAEGKILVVDDEPLVLDLLVDVLEAAGHRVDTASNGDEACRKVGDRSYDMVITDVHMPRMSGLELYREILGRRPELKDRVVFVTGDLIDDEVIDFLAQVNARTLPKPLDLNRLTELVQQTLPVAKN